jgi:mono/diheme cytochrome c family protein
MKRLFIFASAVVALVSLAGAVGYPAGYSAPRAGSSSSAAGAKARLEHGRYLVERVGLCGDCHTPMNEKGEPIAEKALQGAPVVFKPLVPIPNWAEYAPPIAGLARFSDEQAITFLTTGKNPEGKLAAPPMPPFRFSREDAAAILAYLRSLKK